MACGFREVRTTALPESRGGADRRAVAALTVYDMTKALDVDRNHHLRLLERPAEKRNLSRRPRMELV
jgi:molybdenum cofactor biosynthesis enzyme